MRPSNRHPNQLADATSAQRGLNPSKAARTTFTHDPIRESGQPTAHRANDATVMKKVTRYAEGTLIVTRTAALRNPRQTSSQSRPTTRIPASPTSKRSASIVVVYGSSGSAPTRQETTNPECTRLRGRPASLRAGTSWSHSEHKQCQRDPPQIDAHSSLRPPRISRARLPSLSTDLQ